MAGFEKLQEMLDAALKQAGEESSMLLGVTLSSGDSDIINTNRKSYFADMDDAVFVVAVESKEEYQGYFYLLFSLGDAIVMSSILLGIPAPRIAEKRRLCIMEADDIDAFGEIANQIIGSFNSVFQPKLPQKVHLKLLPPPKKYIPEIDQLTDAEPLPDSDYLMYRAPLEIEGQEMHYLDIMVPPELANLFDPQPEEKAAAASPEAATKAEAGEADAESAPRTQSILILSEDVDERQTVREYLTATGFDLVDAPLGADLHELLKETEVRVAVIEVNETGERDLAVCNRVCAQSSKASLPIIMCAGQWTRTAVLKALTYGASDILMKPFDADELMAKVQKYLHAA
ncbi:response regulator [Geotalea toluenoxydans]